MTIVVEDGTGVAAANSYVTVNELNEYALARGIELPAEDTAKEILLIKAMDYIETMENRFHGWRVHSDQPLSFPRWYSRQNMGVPLNLKKAQMVLAIAAHTMELMPTTDRTELANESVKVGPIEVKFREGSSTTFPGIPQVDLLLRDFFAWGGQLRVYPA